MAPNKDARGTRKWGLKNPRRESRGRAALPGFPRGLRRAREERRAAAQGGRAVREVAGARPLSQICVRRALRGAGGGVRGAPRLAGYVRSAHPRAVPGTRVSVRACMGALCLAPRPRFQAVHAGGRVGACSPGRLENLLQQREEASQVFGSFRRGQEPGRKGCASRPLHCCG